jgi:hypothetical protein
VPGLRPAYLDGVSWSPRLAQAFRLTAPCLLTGAAYGCGSAPDLDRLPPHAAIASRYQHELRAPSTCRCGVAAIACPIVAWTWRYESGDGAELNPAEAPSGEPFPTQSDAETWLGENWRELLSAGVDQVTLLDSGRVVYGPMSLHSE